MLEMWNPSEEAERLAARFDGVNQAKFARDFKVPGGASMVSQHIKGRRPITLEAATAYMNGFGCDLADISPRLAEQIRKAANTQAPSTSGKVQRTRYAAPVLSVRPSC